MEPKPMTMWRGRYGVHSNRMEDTDEAVAVTPRADFDALAAEAADARTLRAERAALVKERNEAVKDCGRLDRALRDEAAKADAATARADKAEALLREARGVVGPFLRLLNKAHEIVMPSIRGLFALSKRRQRVENALARIDAHLAAKGQTAPTPADPTNHAPKATSAAVCTELKEP